MTENKAPYDARPIAVLDRVSLALVTGWEWQPIKIMTGTVIGLDIEETATPIAYVALDNGNNVVVTRNALTRVTDRAPTAPAASAFEVICTDYELAVLMGNGSGIEG